MKGGKRKPQNQPTLTVKGDFAEGCNCVFVKMYFLSITSGYAAARGNSPFASVNQCEAHMPLGPHSGLQVGK